MSNLHVFGSRMLNRVFRDIYGTGIVTVNGEMLLTNTIIMKEFLHLEELGVAATGSNVRGSAVFALGTLLDMGGDSCRDGVGRDEDCDDDEKIRVEISIVQSLLSVVSDGSPLVRAEVVVVSTLAHFAFGHNKHLKSIAFAYWKPQSNSLLNSLPSLAHIKSAGNNYTNSNQYKPHGSIVSSQIGSLVRVGNDNPSLVQDGRVSTSSPLANAGIMHGSSLSDDSSQHFDSGVLNDGVSNGVVNHSRSKPLDNAMHSQCVLAMCTLAKDPSPRIASLGQRVLSIIGIEQVVTKPLKPTSGNVRLADPTTALHTPSFAGLARSSSWFDMNGGKFLLVKNMGSLFCLELPYVCTLLCES
ncbi:regulatory-associated protein of TOR 1-like [Quercus suber]|uniref:regulatory-associated protein of TOR 1-like n=1 Tax=Quercus suber TaxID=58331 RepID=UPI0032DE706B